LKNQRSTNQQLLKTHMNTFFPFHYLGEDFGLNTNLFDTNIINLAI